VDLEEGLPVDAPLVYYYGSLTPGDNPDLYRHLVERIGSALDARAARDDHVRSGIQHLAGWSVCGGGEGGGEAGVGQRPPHPAHAHAVSPAHLCSPAGGSAALSCRLSLALH
jgi:hypothetical protein